MNPFIIQRGHSIHMNHAIWYNDTCDKDTKKEASKNIKTGW